MQLDKSKEWTGGVGTVLEWYYEMMPGGHVASPALTTRSVYAATATTAVTHRHGHFLPKWIRMRGALGQGEARTSDDKLHGRVRRV